MLDTGLTTGGRALTPQPPNAIGASLGLLGDEWTLLIVRSAFEGARRYGDWKASLPISDAVLTARLRALVDEDVLRHTAPTYELTASGIDLWPLLLTIWDWERRFVAGQADRLPRMVHAGCGWAFHPVLSCATCHQAVDADSVDATFGPSGSFARSMPVGSNRRRQVSREPAGPGMFSETMAIIGSRWSAAVLGASFLGAVRFRDFEQIGAPPAVVADRLRRFVALGVLAPIRGPHRDAAAYGLTPKGAALFPVVASFLRWGERWRPAADGPSVVATHVACGSPFVPELSCSECAEAIGLSALRIEPVRSTAPASASPRR